jgi:hypothetical protein
MGSRFALNRNKHIRVRKSHGKRSVSKN